MTNPNKLRIYKKSSSNLSTVSDCSVVLLPHYEDQGSGGSGREMLTTNGQNEEDYKRRLTRQNDKVRATTDCQEYRDFHEMNLNQNTFDEVIGRIGLKSFREIDSSYENIADLQDYIQEDISTDPMVNALDVLLERRNSLNNDNYDQNSLDASDLVERGSIKYNKFNRNCPYSKNSTNWSGRNNQSANMSFTRKQQKIEKSMVESKEGQTNGGICSIFDDNWQSKTNDDQSTTVSKENNSMQMTTTTSIPSIVVNDHGENTVLTILGKGADHGAQVFSDASNSSIISQATRTWPDSPLSCYNNIGISRPNSRCSSCTQPPTSGMQFESQLMPSNVSGSPIGSPQIPTTYTPMQGQSSPSSSSQSYGDIPSPLNYQKPVNRRIEERLHKDFAGFTIWSTFLDDQGNMNETVPTFDSNELQLLDEVLRSQGERNEEAQVVPRSDDYSSSYDNRPSSVRTFENELERMSSTKNDTQTFPSTSSSPYGEQSTSFTNYSSSLNDLPYTYVATQNPPTNSVYGESQTQVSNFYDYNDIWNTGNDMRYENANALQSNMEFVNFKQDTVTYANRQNSSNATNSCSLPTSFQSFTTLPSMSTNVAENRRRRCSSASGISYPDTSFNDFQIPEMVSSFKSNRSQRSNERSIMPWPSLNLPSTGASKRLKEELKPKDVEMAMSQLLEINDEELTTVDNDGYTKLMCLMSNPEDLAKKKAYLVPLVERLSNFKDALSRKNNRGEDALYLAAICCPEMPYIAGYLAATMLQKGIDINQNLYHTRGDTLIHSVSARGDSHGEVLAELLALKTSQGYAVFDLSKCNYDGRTALHVAVESHDPTGRNIKAVATVRLLLDNGADLNIKDTKSGDTALHMAAGLSCDPALVKVLLNKAVSGTVNAINYNYNTPLHMAAACNTVPLERQKEVCWLLTQAGGQTNIYNKQGKTPLALVSAERKDLIRRIFYKKF